MERIASGYQLAEAPVATDDGGVVFSDVLGGGAHRWNPATGAVEVVIPKRRGIGGMARHEDGGLVVSGRDVVHVRAGVNRTIYAPDETSGVAGMNDLTVDPDGRVVVGHLRFRPFAGEAPVPGEFVTVDGDGGTSDVVTGVEWVNGCAFSPNDATFYGCDANRGVVLAADRRADGSYSPSRIVVRSPTGIVDGMALDESGALWVALGPSGTVGRFTPEGELDSELEVSESGFVSSLCFGGSDGRDLFVTTAGNAELTGAGGAVFHTRVGVAGAPITPVRI
jgi:gluconolactonase